jgi:hypothetical protein
LNHRSKCLNDRTPEKVLEMITIVSGLPRSGTSMMMKILEAGGLPVLADGIRTADIDNPNGYYEFEPVKSTCDDSSWLTMAEGRVVKMIYKLLYDLPEQTRCRIVFMQRALKEVIKSQNAMLQRRGETGYTGTETHNLVGTFAAEVSSCKKWLAAKDDMQVIYMNYNRLLAEPEAEIDKLNSFFDDRLNAAAMLAVINPALYRRRDD